MVQHPNLREAAYSQSLLHGNTAEPDTGPDTEPDTVGVFNAIKAAWLRFSRLMCFFDGAVKQPEPQTEPLCNVTVVSVKV